MVIMLPLDLVHEALAFLEATEVPPEFVSGYLKKWWAHTKNDTAALGRTLYDAAEANNEALVAGILAESLNC